MKRIIAVLLCIFTIVLCACQPTPEEEYIVNKGDNIAEDRINATALPAASAGPEGQNGEPQGTDGSEASPWQDASGQAVFPERWEGNIKTDYKEMIISADVVTSGMESYPVMLLRKGSFNAEDVIKAARYLFNGEKVTGWLNSTLATREYLIEAMQRVAASDMKEEEKADQLEAIRMDLEGRELSDADIVSCSSLDEITVGGRGVTVYTENGGGYINYQESGISVNTELHAFAMAKSSWGIDPDAPKFSAGISLEDALSAAEEFFASMGVEGFELYFSDEAISIKDRTGETVSTGWQLNYIRSYGYIPFSVSQYDAGDYFDFGSKWDDAAEYSEPFKEETIRLYVTEDGVKSAAFSNRYECVETVNENVRLCDFGELTRKIEFLFRAAINSPYQSEGYYVIEEMILTVLPTPKKDSTDYYLMPVWVCKMGSYVSLGDGLGVSPFYIPGEQVFEGWETIAFNAIDGTRVAMPKG